MLSGGWGRPLPTSVGRTLPLLNCKTTVQHVVAVIITHKGTFLVFTDL